MTSHAIQFSSYIYRYDEATDTEEEFDVTVHAYLEPEEPRSWDSPGHPAQAEVWSVIRDGQEIVDTLSEEEIETLEERAFQEAADREEGARARALDERIDEARERCYV